MSRELKLGKEDLQRHLAEVDRLRAENAKLRATLTEVRDISTKWGNSIPWKEGERLAEICATVLKD